MALTFTAAATAGAARTGTVTTARGSYRTPCFMPVGTRGAVRTLAAGDLEDLGASVVLGNTYHLMLRPGADVVAELGGIHGFNGWRGHVLTDSGGFQVFSLEPDVDDEGVTFRSTYDGSLHRLTPESAVAVQAALGSDIQMVLDVCSPLPSTHATIRLALERTAAWAERARRAHLDDATAEPQGRNQFGIVQGGTDVAMRAESAERTVGVLDGAGFDGYGIGGLSVGEPREEMLPALESAVAHLPADRPRYLMGVGDPVGLVEGVARGVDMFDCVLPTRLARHGTALTSAGKMHIRNASNARHDGPIDPTCTCPVCARYSRAYLRHLHVVGEQTAARLLTIHNLAWTFALIDAIRSAVEAGEDALARLREEVGAVWG